jgi:outer membrane lipoprotein SlyB
MKTIIIFVLVISLAGCSHYHPIIDTQGVDQAQLEQDLKECQEYADQISPGKTALFNAGVGAGIGAIIGLAVGVAFDQRHAGQLAAFGASIGGVKGAVNGGAYAGLTQQQIVCRCMMGRGYNVLQ